MTAGEGRDPFSVDEDRALDALALAWGDDYKIYVTGGRWQARHRDALLAHISPGHSDNINFFGVINVDIEAELAKLTGGWVSGKSLVLGSRLAHPYSRILVK